MCDVATVGKNKASSARLSPSHNSALVYSVISNHIAEENEVGNEYSQYVFKLSYNTRVLNEYEERKIRLCDRQIFSRPATSASIAEPIRTIAIRSSVR